MPAPPLSDEAVKRATEKTWAEWIAWLDARGARDLDHKGIVALLKDEIDSGWWRQMVAGGYERIALGRAKHEMPDGFQVQASKTIDAPPEIVWETLHEDGRLNAWTPGGDIAVSKRRDKKDVRGEWASSAKTTARFGASLRAAPNGKTRLVVQIRKLPDAEAAEAAKTAWRDALASLKDKLETR